MKKQNFTDANGHSSFMTRSRGASAFSTIHSIIMFGLLLIIPLSGLKAQVSITTPHDFFGIDIGDDYNLVNYTSAVEYWKILEKESPRMIIEEIGTTAEGRPQYMATISSPENISNLDRYRDISRKLALAKDITEEEARMLSQEGKSVIWIDGGLHATEVVGSHQLIETVYRLVSADDAETMRILDDVIILAVFANPDGLELVADWYMRKDNPEDRSTGNLPRLYHKYVGHDNNRDSYMVTQPETENMARIMYRTWYPQIMYNHHQTGPNGLIVFIPPFRDPVNYNFDPLLITGIETVGIAMHNRLISEGKPGSGMRSSASYSTWFNGNLRTTGYFHNQLGILTEIKGNPTPVEIEFNPARQLQTTDIPYPVEPGIFPFRDAIEYSYTMNMAILDYASRYREPLLYNRYLMGRNNIEKGSRDNWTIHPKVIDELNRKVAEEAGRGGQQGAAQARGRRGLSPEYMKYLRLPENRDPRAYIIPSDQPDFPTAVKFVNTFIKNGVTVHTAVSDFVVGGKRYPAGSFIFKTDQAFRPHILDLFEPQDHPNDFAYEGGPPIRPYDNAGYTLAFQMGIDFDRIFEPVEGNFKELTDLASPLKGLVTGSSKPAGYLLDHSVNDAAIVMNRLIAEKEKIFWLGEEISYKGKKYPAGTIYIPSSRSADAVVTKAASELGINFTGLDASPKAAALKINPVRIGLWDRYGGSMPSGWTRWVMEQFEFPFEIVYPKRLDSGNLNRDFDVLVFVTGAISGVESRYASSMESNVEDIPEEYREWLGRVTSEVTIPKLIEFIRNGGTIVAIGSSTAIAESAELPITDHIVDGEGKHLTSDKYYIPASILQVRVDNTVPVAYGMEERVDVFFDNSPVFRLKPEADKQGITTVAWFDSDRSLRSGWAWGQDRLYGGVAIADAKIGKGNLYLFGPEILYRAQSHGTFKLLFNGIYLSASEKVENIR